MASFTFATRSHPAPAYFVRLRELLEQPDEALVRLLVIARESRSVGSIAEIDEIVAAVHGADPHVLYGALGGVGLIMRNIPDPEVSAAQVYDALLALAPEDAAGAMRAKHAFLVELLGVLLERRDDLAIRALGIGPADIVRAVNASVTLTAAVRPDDSIAGYLPIALVRIETAHEYLVLQFDESRLAQFVREIEEIAGRMAVVRAHAGDRLTVYPSPDSSIG